MLTATPSHRNQIPTRLGLVAIALTASPTVLLAQFPIGSSSGFFSAVNPRSIAVADFNLDGKPDLAVANQDNHTLAIYSGNGSGGFSMSSSVASGPTAQSSPRAVAIGDFNLDGIPDVAVANWGSNYVSVHFGNGAGGIASRIDTQVVASPISVAVADFNLDGRPDVAVANDASNGVTVLLNRSSDFQRNSFTIGSAPHSVAVGDFNGDGKPDIAVANSLENNVRVMLGNGAGAFSGSPSNPIGAGNSPEAVIVGDFNGDGKLDLAVANANANNITVLLGNGTGGFTPAPASPFPSFGTGPNSLAAGDFDGDGKLDLAITNRAGNSMSVLMGNGAGGFSPAPGPYGLGSPPNSVAVGDFNLDGKPDLAVVIESNLGLIYLNQYPAITVRPSSLTFWAGAGQGSPAALPVAVSSTLGYSVSSNQSWLHVAPTAGASGSTSVTISADSSLLPAGSHQGIVRLTGPNSFGAAIGATVHIANPSGTLIGSTGSPFTTGTNPRCIAAADFNGDGKLDLVTTNVAANNATVLLGNGAGGFTAAPGSPFTTGAFPQSVAVGDFNGDGKLDLAIANNDSNNVTVLRGDGTGGFVAAPGSPFAVGGDPTSIAVGDFNRDGRQDLVITNQTSHTVLVLLATPSGTFTEAPGGEFGVGNRPYSVAVGDFNGDGKTDIAVAKSYDNNVSVWLGDGNGGFSGATTLGTGTNPTSVAVQDFNGDGKPDIAVSSQGSNNVTVLLGDGAGGFAPAPGSPFATGAGPYSVAVGDFNGDGKPDLVTANLNGNNLTVLIGNGAGGFAPAVALPFGTTPVSLAVGDFNGDGKTDVAAANIDASTVTVGLGATAPTTSTLSAPSGATVEYGQPVSLNLAASCNGPCFNTPAGSATFLDGAVTLGSATQTSTPYTFTGSGLGVGSHTIKAVYSGDTRVASSTSNSVVIQVNQASQTISFTQPADVTYGAAPFSISATASSNLPVVFNSNSPSVCTIAGSMVTILGAGACSITASQGGNTNFSAAAPVTQIFNVVKATPSITWPQPAPITFGSALGSTQLNATASVPGTFVYTPAAGAVLPVGNAQTLSVLFTPANTNNYNRVNATTTIDVLAAGGSPARLVTTSTLARDASNNVAATLTIANTGGTAAQNVILTVARIGTVSATPLPRNIGAIPAGSSVQITVTFPASVGAPGAAGVLTLSGTYSGGTFSSSSRIVLP